MDKLIEAGNLLARGRLSSTPIRTAGARRPRSSSATRRSGSSAWMSLDSGNTLRETALQAIADTAFHPDAGRNRIGSMVETRPDWLVSRQRAWGTPLAMFVDKDTGAP
jgi:isoleucyl-tRNA synthetase